MKNITYLNRIGISKIENDCLWLKSGGCFGIISVKPVNFYSMKDGKKKNVLNKYQEWLESLDYPVQICGRTINTDINEHIKILKVTIEHSIKQQKNYNRLLDQFREFIKWLSEFTEANCVSGRLYYVSIPFFPEKGQDNSVLNIRCENAVKLLCEAGLSSKRLTDDELKNLYSSYFNDYIILNNSCGKECIESKTWLKLWRDQHGS